MYDLETRIKIIYVVPGLAMIKRVFIRDIRDAPGTFPPI